MPHVLLETTAWRSTPDCAVLERCDRPPSRSAPWLRPVPALAIVAPDFAFRRVGRQSCDYRRPGHVPARRRYMRHQRSAVIPSMEVRMQTQVSILHHDYPARVREQVEQKLQHLVKFYGRIVSMRALLERQHEEHRVEIVANVGQGAVLVVDARGTAFGTALEEALGRMERLLKRHNDKHNDLRRRSGRAEGGSNGARPS